MTAKTDEILIAALQDINIELKRIAKAMEDSNNMIKDISGSK